MRKTGKKNLKIAGATSIALFSLVTVFTATIAWFALNKRVDSSGTAINAQEPSGRLYKITVHPYDKKVVHEDDNKPYYSFQRTGTVIFGEGAANPIPTFNLGQYDPLDYERPLLIVFELREQYTTSSNVGDIYIKGSTKTEGFLGATNTDGSPVYGLGPGTDLCTTIDGIDYYPLSSAVNFKCAAFSTSTYSTALSKSVANNKIDIDIGLIKLNQSFVNFPVGSTIASFTPKPTIYSSPASTAIKYVAMVVNYDSNAISAIYSAFLGNTYLEGASHYDGKLNFVCDWSLEIF